MKGEGEVNVLKARREEKQRHTESTAADQHLSYTGCGQKGISSGCTTAEMCF